MRVRAVTASLETEFARKKKAVESRMEPQMGHNPETWGGGGGGGETDRRRDVLEDRSQGWTGSDDVGSKIGQML